MEDVSDDEVQCRRLLCCQPAVVGHEEGAKLDTDVRSSAWLMMNDISFATCPKHDRAQQTPTKYRSARAGRYHQLPGIVRPHRRSPGGEVCPDAALNCSLTGVRSSNQSTPAHAARIE